MIRNILSLIRVYVRLLIMLDIVGIFLKVFSVEVMKLDFMIIRDLVVISVSLMSWKRVEMFVDLKKIFRVYRIERYFFFYLNDKMINIV